MNYCLAGVTGDPETFSQAASSEYCVGMDFKVKVTLSIFLYIPSRYKNDLIFPISYGCFQVKLLSEMTALFARPRLASVTWNY